MREGRGVRVLINEISAGTISVVFIICFAHACKPTIIRTYVHSASPMQNKVLRPLFLLALAVACRNAMVLRVQNVVYCSPNISFVPRSRGWETREVRRPDKAALEVWLGARTLVQAWSTMVYCLGFLVAAPGLHQGVVLPPSFLLPSFLPFPSFLPSSDDDCYLLLLTTTLLLL